MLLSRHQPELVTAVAETEQDLLSQAARLVDGGQVTDVGRTGSVAFDYLSPITSPSISGVDAQLHSPIEIDGDNVLAYGMIEHGGKTVRAKRLVLDPQNPRGAASQDLDSFRADAMVLSTNLRELANLTPGGLAAQDSASILKAAEAVQSRKRLEGVIVRCGARGSLVVHGQKSKWLNATPTTAVWSLGSGDVYSAALAHAWMKGADLVDAAESASNTTAWWVSSLPNSSVPEEILEGRISLNEYRGDRADTLRKTAVVPRVYLAGPFFNVPERWMVETCLSVLTGLGGDVFSPIHHVGVGGDEVAVQDIDGLRNSDVVFALLDGFDPGTVFEVGWAARHGIPTVGYLHHAELEGTKMLVGLGAELHDDLTTALYRAIWVGQGEEPRPERFLRSKGQDFTK